MTTTELQDLFVKPPWPHQLQAVKEVLQAIDDGYERVCVTAPTGGGKSIVMMALIFHYLEQGKNSVVYQNRRALVDQFTQVFEANGIPFGVRSSSFKEHLRLLENVQISSMQTENSWVYTQKKRSLHDAQIVQIDESHQAKRELAQKILNDHDCPKVGWTATPLEIDHMYDKLIVAGTKKELRECGALLPADVFTGPEVNTSKLKHQGNGEFSPQDIQKLYTSRAKTVLGAEVIKWWRKCNPDQTPTVLFAPGVPESIWFCQQFEAQGVRAAHIDGNDIYLDGSRYSTNESNRRWILRDFADGNIKVLCNRFVLREGIDVPEMGCVLLATPFGSLTSYIQSVGRVLRNHPSLERVTVVDFGGNWHRHPNPNVDIPWEELWHKKPLAIANQRADRLRDKTEREPMRCPACGQIRMGGSIKCLCGHQYDKSVREVIQLNGTVRQVEGDVYKPRRRDLRPDTEKLWEAMYHRAKKSRNKMTFRQAEGFFALENFYWPPRDLPKMPLDPADWDRRVAEVDSSDLTRAAPNPVTVDPQGKLF